MKTIGMPLESAGEAKERLSIARPVYPYVRPPAGTVALAQQAMRPAARTSRLITELDRLKQEFSASRSVGWEEWKTMKASKFGCAKKASL